MPAIVATEPAGFFDRLDLLARRLVAPGGLYEGQDFDAVFANCVQVNYHSNIIKIIYGEPDSLRIPARLDYVYLGEELTVRVLPLNDEGNIQGTPRPESLQDFDEHDYDSDFANLEL